MTTPPLNAPRLLDIEDDSRCDNCDGPAGFQVPDVGQFCDDACHAAWELR